ncbi:MAG: GNAT family N-acetyltransferase [Hyphomonas sp.]|uniref:GNAT family N-acetyltransferase n=1 Tax=Hyphomonas sp. TaxID=87 RepID=UPI001DE12386|nr:GNAT family N-acetyltransferase [Hyphomonas sp.]MBA4227051.1 GNAT family N-acetyltransferase [Hyphomonas sp.]
MAAEIRSGKPEDAEAAIQTLRRSITELCRADHGDDPEALESWLANKTEASWHDWLGRADRLVFVAEQDGLILGVGMISTAGEVMLNYVEPDARFAGISKKLLTHMERGASERGLGCCFLESTRTALNFYLACGYAPVNTGESERRLEKRLGG